MITALLLIFDASRTWERIGNSPEQRVSRVFFAYLFPVWLLSIVGESLGLLKLGMSKTFLRAMLRHHRL